MRLGFGLRDLEVSARVCLRDGRCAYGPWPENHILCPLYLKEPSFTFTGGGYLFLLLALLEGRINFSEEVAEFLFSCAGCLACDENCHIIGASEPHAGIAEAIRLLRSEAVRRGFMPERVRRVYEEVRRSKDLGEPWKPRAYFQPSDDTNLFAFAGCAHWEGTERALQAMEKLVERIGVQVSFLEAKGCCGAALYEYGLWDGLSDFVQEQWQTMKGKRILFLNPHCHYFVARIYPEIVGDSVETVFVTEFLLSALREGRLKSKQRQKVKVSYHDPCYLGRGLRVFEEPRQILSQLEGVEVVEMVRNRESSFCCGSRIMGSYIPDLSEQTARERIREFGETGADLLVTACGECVDSFKRFLGHERVKHIVEFVEERT